VVRHDYGSACRARPLCGAHQHDAEDYGGSGIGNAGAVDAEPHPMHGHGYSLRLQLRRSAR